MKLEEFEEQTRGGQIFSVLFTKRTTGELRKMVCRRGVKKGVKGVGMAYKPSEKGLMAVYDLQKIEEGKDEKGAFRMINLMEMHEVHMKGKIFKWNDELEEFVEVARA